MKFLQRFTLASLLLLLSFPGYVQAQESENLNPNRIRVAYGDGIYLTTAMSMMDHLLGGDIFQTGDLQAIGTFSLGYRRMTASGRWSFGGDISYFRTKEKSALGSTSYNFVGVMAAVDCYYLKSGLVRLYGTLDMGALLSSGGSGFMGQFNPIAVRVGNNRIGGFLELGVGYKGVTNFGVEIGF